MATTYKVLGQSNPSATTATTLYTVPSATSAVVSTLVITNQAASAGTFRVAVRVAGASLEAKQYLAYDVAIGANDSTSLTLGLTLAATDVVTIYASSATMSFNLFGSEITA
jgi:glucose-6-phosphate dehydrogenase assembly protein OpcA